MAGSNTGTIFRSQPGENHMAKASVSLWTAVPVVSPLSEEDIQIYLNRRKPGQSANIQPHGPKQTG